MKAMLLEKICDLRTEREPLRLAELPLPEPGPCEVRLRQLSLVPGRPGEPLPGLPGHRP